MKTLTHRLPFAALAVLLLPCSALQANEVEQFYKGKAINFYIGFGPGGGYDTYARLLSKHMGQQIPGKPSITPMNMPGGGGLIAANHLYNVAPRDGAHLAMFGAFNALEPLFGNKKASFETMKFTWIGNMNVDSVACAAWASSGVKAFEDLTQREVVFGSSGAASTTSQHALALQNLLGAKVKVVTGYSGTKEINLAMQRGEVDASCGINASSAAAQWGKDIAAGNLRIIIQFGRKDHPEFGEAANVYKLLKGDDDRRVADLVFGANEIGRPVAAPPDIPPARAQALRQAFAATLKDEQFLQDAQRAKIPIDPMTHQEMERTFGQFLAYPPEIVTRAMTAIGRKGS